MLMAMAGQYRLRLLGKAAPNSAVVPADAGTPNHRERCCDRPRAARPIDRFRGMSPPRARGRQLRVGYRLRFAAFLLCFFADTRPAFFAVAFLADAVAAFPADFLEREAAAFFAALRADVFAIVALRGAAFLATRRFFRTGCAATGGTSKGSETMPSAANGIEAAAV